MDKSAELETPVKAPETAAAPAENGKKPLNWDLIRNILIGVTALLVIAIVVFQALEVDTYDLFPVIQSRLSALFK